MELAVVPVTRTLPGVPAERPGWSAAPPAQDEPLTVQLVGSPVPAAMKPKLAVAFGPRVPFQPLLVKVNRWPLRVMSASQKLPTEVPARQVERRRSRT